MAADAERIEQLERLVYLPNSPFLKRAQVLEAYGGRSVSWLYNGMAAGQIPRPVRIGPNSVAWVTEEIRRDIVAKIAAGPVEITTGRHKRKAALNKLGDHHGQ
jgi:predicted DNA-binding transcriptional regulator AlpA